MLLVSLAIFNIICFCQSSGKAKKYLVDIQDEETDTMNDTPSEVPNSQPGVLEKGLKKSPKSQRKLEFHKLIPKINTETYIEGEIKAAKGILNALAIIQTLPHAKKEEVTKVLASIGELPSEKKELLKEDLKRINEEKDQSSDYSDYTFPGLFTKGGLLPVLFGALNGGAQALPVTDPIGAALQGALLGGLNWLQQNGQGQQAAPAQYPQGGGAQYPQGGGAQYPQGGGAQYPQGQQYAMG